MLTHFNRKPLQRSWIKRGKSPRKKAIDMAKKEIKKILYHKYGHFCFFCGKAESHFKYPLSIFHILPVGSHPRLELEINNMLLVCWAKEYYVKCCHNLWEHRVEPYRTNMELVLCHRFGTDYKDKLLIQEKISPKLNIVRAMYLYEHYKMEYKNLGGNL